MNHTASLRTSSLLTYLGSHSVQLSARCPFETPVLRFRDASGSEFSWTSGCPLARKISALKRPGVQLSLRYTVEGSAITRVEFAPVC